MREFTYHRARTIEDAMSVLGDDGTRPMGGGTDLLVALDEGIVRARRVLDLRAIDGSDEIAEHAGGIRIGATALLGDVAAHPLIRERFAALAEACESSASPALRNMGTLGGNLCQRPRCWYFRRAIPCLKNGGVDCPAREGENQYHAILEGGPCFIVHPSDPAVALVALDASIEITGPDGTRTVPIEDFHVLPSERLDSETILRDGEIVTAVELPAAASGGRQFYRKLMQRGAWDFALCSIAAARRSDGSVRMALGGVAPRPWRVPTSVEEDVASGSLDPESITALVERAMYDAEPLSKNGYKVSMAQALLEDAIRVLS